MPFTKVHLNGFPCTRSISPWFVSYILLYGPWYCQFEFVQLSTISTGLPTVPPPVLHTTMVKLNEPGDFIPVVWLADLTMVKCGGAGVGSMVRSNPCL